MLFCTGVARAQDERPTAEYDVPRPVTINQGEKAYQCFPPADWATMAHIIIDYRALHAWAPLIEHRLELRSAEVVAMERHVSLLDTALEASERARLVTIDALEAENAARLDLEKRSGLQRSLQWIAVGLLAAADIALVSWVATK